jgi:homoserine kinase
MGMRRQAEFEIKVPASIANLGPGFDTLAVAVQLYLRLLVRKVEGQGQLKFHFVDQELRGENYIERAFRFLARQSDTLRTSVDVEVRSEIPMCSGLGSSAAATIAGIRLFDALAGPLSDNEMLNAACALEGHPDNVAAALFGGLTASCQLPDGSVTATRMRWPERLRMIVLTPHAMLRTSDAREVLPGSIERRDAVHNLQRVVLLLNSLRNEDYSLLREALNDRLHQPYREPLVPGLTDLLSMDHPDLLGVCLSGAGPSIVAFATRSHDIVASLLSRKLCELKIEHSVRIVSAEPAFASGQHAPESISVSQ